ncbi:hypothetical protein [Cereibacter azotoformans]|uniref:hypothetical protein n=1 Tax=Cereibacter azotoformans TaxID=43057 RepID=UPI000C6DA7AC|nr:hypothetical protein [Cereibacter azotoformans]
MDDKFTAHHVSQVRAVFLRDRPNQRLLEIVTADGQTFSFLLPASALETLGKGLLADAALHATKPKTRRMQ